MKAKTIIENDGLEAWIHAHLKELATRLPKFIPMWVRHVKGVKPWHFRESLPCFQINEVIWEMVVLDELGADARGFGMFSLRYPPDTLPRAGGKIRKKALGFVSQIPQVTTPPLRIRAYLGSWGPPFLGSLDEVWPYSPINVQVALGEFELAIRKKIFDQENCIEF